MYSVLNDPDAPATGSNAWFLVVNFPSSQGVDYSYLFAVSYWSEPAVGGKKIWLKRGTGAGWSNIPFAS